MSTSPAKKIRLTAALTMSAMQLSTSAALSLNVHNARVVSSIPPLIDGLKLTTIGTHDGSFHCDEALACGMLKLLPTYADSVIVRSRNPTILGECDIVVDVGAVYSQAENRFDHHQRGFTEVLGEGYNTKLSSAGLVYKHFGKDILREILPSSSPDLIDVCYKRLYENFIEHIDAIDNGISVCDGSPRYMVSTTLSSRVGHLNPAWNEPTTTELYSERFVQAMVMTCSEFVAAAQRISDIWWPARSIVRAAIDERFSSHPSGSIIVFTQYCPWKDHLHELEQELGIDPIIYALYPDAGGSWRIQAVPVESESFSSRKQLPVDWCGLRDAELSAKTGIEGGIFIHANGFIGAHQTKEGAMAMAVAALEMV